MKKVQGELSNMGHTVMMTNLRSRRTERCLTGPPAYAPSATSREAKLLRPWNMIDIDEDSLPEMTGRRAKERRSHGTLRRTQQVNVKQRATSEPP